ncbi:MAG: hypothetical protein RL329_1117 [Bacteroidota bacterium]
MKNKITAFFTNELSPDERAQVEARVEIDPMFAAEFDFQASLFDALETERLRYKIQKTMAEERLRKVRQQKWLKKSIGGAILLGAFAVFFLSQPFKNQIVPPIEKNNLAKMDTVQNHQILPKDTPVVQEQPLIIPPLQPSDDIRAACDELKVQEQPLIIPPLQPQIQVRPKKPSKVAAPQQGLQPAPKTLRPNDSIFAHTQPIPPQETPIGPVGTGARTWSNPFQMDRRILNCVIVESQLTQKYKQPLSPEVKQLLQNYCAQKSSYPILTAGRFNADLSWVIKAVYNIEIKEYASARYCLAKIEPDSDFLLEKQFCEALIHPNIPIKADFLKIFERDTFSIFHETAKDLLKK